MTVSSHGTHAASDGAFAVLDVLAQAARGQTLAPERRIVATPDRFNPDEGLALLDAYLGIADTSVRQAVLDIVVAISESNPFRRAHRADATACSPRKSR